jgi:hypothetical protein
MYLYDNWALYRDAATRTRKNTLGVYWSCWMIAIGVRSPPSLLPLSRPRIDTPHGSAVLPRRRRLLRLHSRYQELVRRRWRTALRLHRQLKQHLDLHPLILSYKHSFPLSLCVFTSVFPLFTGVFSFVTCLCPFHLSSLYPWVNIFLAICSLHSRGLDKEQSRNRGRPPPSSSFFPVSLCFRSWLRTSGMRKG